MESIALSQSWIPIKALDLLWNTGLRTAVVYHDSSSFLWEFAGLSSARPVHYPLDNCIQMVAWAGVTMSVSSLTDLEVLLAVSSEVNWGWVLELPYPPFPLHHGAWISRDRNRKQTVSEGLGPVSSIIQRLSYKIVSTLSVSECSVRLGTHFFIRGTSGTWGAMVTLYGYLYTLKYVHRGVIICLSVH